jgi:hypothetical protein|tara:strand:+ start:5612 stop:5800 length:189 start_codon:yes stop_codon:yes gene_type:complete
METVSKTEIRLECLRFAVEFGSVANIKDPIPLANMYYKWVMDNPDKVDKSIVTLHPKGKKSR